MDGINRHAITSQPSFGSNTRTTRFRLNLPTSLIRQLQPILKNNSTSTTKQKGGRISPDDRREELRDSPATKSSGCLSAKREPRRVSTDRRSLPKAVARVVPQGAERALCGVQTCRAICTANFVLYSKTMIMI